MSKLTHTIPVTKVANVCNEHSLELVKTGQLLVRPKGKKLSMDLMNLVRKQVELNITTLKHGKPYTLRRICGEEFWSQLNKGEPNKAGECMVYMTEQNTLPLTCVGKTGSNDKLYQLK
jgi:hypothetical protein